MTTAFITTPHGGITTYSMCRMGDQEVPMSNPGGICDGGVTGRINSALAAFGYRLETDWWETRETFPDGIRVHVRQEPKP